VCFITSVGLANQRHYTTAYTVLAIPPRCSPTRDWFSSPQHDASQYDLAPFHLSKTSLSSIHGRRLTCQVLYKLVHERHNCQQSCGCGAEKRREFTGFIWQCVTWHICYHATQLPRSLHPFFAAWSGLDLYIVARVSTQHRQESSAKLTNQRVSYAFTSSPFSFHACHIFPASTFQ